jgi:microcin C transport system permease protein
VAKIWKESFKNLIQDRKGLWSLRVFLSLVALSVFLPLIANHNPLLVRYHGTFFFPMMTTYAEKDMGGVSPVQVNFQEDGFQSIILKEGWILWPPIPYNAESVDYTLQLSGPQKPSLKHWLGTDEQGRDLLARILYALRFSLLFGLAVTLLSGSMGILVGAFQGYRGGVTDLVMQRILEIWFSIPVLFLMMIVVSLVSLNIFILCGALVLIKWRTLVPMVRTLFLRARTLPYVEAARMLGHNPSQIVLHHILPTVIFLPLSRFPFMMVSSISILTSLDFFGFSLPDAALSLGGILVQGKNHLYASWIVLGGMGALMILLMTLIFLGEALQKVFIVNHFEE